MLWQKQGTSDVQDGGSAQARPMPRLQRRRQVMADKGISLGQGICKAQTEKAILVELKEVGSKWIPQSCVHDDSEVYGYGHSGNVVVHLWWAESKGLA